MSCGPPVARAGGLAAVRAAPRDAYSFIEGRRAATVGAHPAPPALPACPGGAVGAVGDEAGVCRHMPDKLPGRPPTSGNAPRTDECRVWCHIGRRIHPVDATRWCCRRSEGRVGRPKGLYRWVRPDERVRIAAGLGAGESPGELALRFGCSVRTVQRIGDEALLVRRRVSDSSRWLSFEERERISRGIAAGESDSEIARALGRHRSTVGREIRAGCGQRRGYRALAAERKSRERARRPKPTKLSLLPRLLAEVEAGLERCWSPQQISARLNLDHPEDGEMRISSETIYQSLFVQSLGALRRQLSASLRSGRGRRRAQG